MTVFLNFLARDWSGPCALLELGFALSLPLSFLSAGCSGKLTSHWLGTVSRCRAVQCFAVVASTVGFPGAKVHFPWPCLSTHIASSFQQQKALAQSCKNSCMVGSGAKVICVLNFSWCCFTDHKEQAAWNKKLELREKTCIILKEKEKALKKAGGNWKELHQAKVEVQKRGCSIKEAEGAHGKKKQEVLLAGQKMKKAPKKKFDKDTNCQRAQASGLLSSCQT